MNRKELFNRIKEKGSYLCVGLDTDPLKLPSPFKPVAEDMYAFNKAIIESTSPYAVSYKINTAFYESMGTAGWQVMEDTLKLIPSECFTIADAKRGDIGNTSNMYARAFFENMNFDSVTLAPYMGKDSLSPFFEYPGKWGIVLALTSNPGSADYEQKDSEGMKLYERVIQTTVSYTNPDNVMFVVGATKPEGLAKIREMIPGHFMLVPGVGAQGGDLNAVSDAGLNEYGGLLINASRSIIYASSGPDFAKSAANEAASMATEMNTILKKKNLI